MTATTPKPKALLQAKWELIGQALTDPVLSSGDCAALWSICERYNEQVGAAWPSFTVLATDTGRNRATIQRSIARLIEAGWLKIIEHGGRTTSNRYRPEFERQKVGASTHPPLGASTHGGGCISVLDVGASTRPESIYEPGYEAGVSKWNPPAAGAASGGGGGASPGAAPAPPGGGRRYPEFWAAYPKATGVFKAEQVLDRLLGDGAVSLAEIVSGARRYAAYIKAQPWSEPDRWTRGAHNWLEARGWLDDWQATPKESPARRLPNASTQGSRGQPKPQQGPKSGAGGAQRATQGHPGAQLVAQSLARRNVSTDWEPWRRWHAIVSVSNYRKAWREAAGERLRQQFPQWWPLVSGTAPEVGKVEKVPVNVVRELSAAIQRERADLNRQRDEAARQREELRQTGGAAVALPRVPSGG